MAIYPDHMLHYDQLLTNISTQLTNEPTWADALTTKIPVANKSDMYIRWENREQFQAVDDLRAPGSRAKEIMGTVFDRDAYDCQDHALAIRVTDEERAQADSPLDPDATAVQIVTGGIQKAREKRIHDLLNDTNIYHGDLTGDPGNWDLPATDIIEDIREAKYAMHKKIFRYPNTMIMPLGVWAKIQDNSKIVDAIKYTQRGVYDLDLFSSLVGMNVIIPTGGILGDNDGSAKTGSSNIEYLWKEDRVFLLHVGDGPTTRTISFLWEFVWTGVISQGINMYRFRQEQNWSDVIVGRRYYDFHLATIDESRPDWRTAPKSLCAYMFTGVTTT